ncbi:hypothetical protein B9Z55_012957 [Caenorhabditis nigoni]|uniref:Uncharacterized protein n=1 Tax=Caenorhabditis nigoni TaxID=1611254 RepID=A0A2G5TZT0_9PELO|nr:hypothetical protein B9Z55_012957 [Caenorhabditis nigoni]
MKIIDYHLDKLANKRMCRGGTVSHKRGRIPCTMGKWKAGILMFTVKNISQIQSLDRKHPEEKGYVRCTVHRHDNHVEEHKFKCVECGKWAHLV